MPIDARKLHQAQDLGGMPGGSISAAQMDVINRALAQYKSMNITVVGEIPKLAFQVPAISDETWSRFNAAIAAHNDSFGRLAGAAQASVARIMESSVVAEFTRFAAAWPTSDMAESLSRMADAWRDAGIWDPTVTVPPHWEDLADEEAAELCDSVVDAAPAAAALYHDQLQEAEHLVEREPWSVSRDELTILVFGAFIDLAMLCWAVTGNWEYSTGLAYGALLSLIVFAIQSGKKG